MKQIKNKFTTLSIATALIVLVCITSIHAYAQNNKLLDGSGIITTKNYTIEAFDKVQVQHLNGKVHIELGKPFSITVKADDNLDSLISIEKNKEDILAISMKTPKKYGWIRYTNIEITICMPEISKLYNNSNSNVNINNFTGRYIGIVNSNNGNVILKGSTVDLLDIDNTNNGDVQTKTIVAKEVNVNNSGNGSVTLKTNNTFKTKLTGNGNIVNYSTGKAEIIEKSGNGDILYNND
jgi:hypothetical protein